MPPLLRSSLIAATLLVLAPLDHAGGSTNHHGTSSPRLLDVYGRLPLSFERNAGQIDAPFSYLARGQGYGLLVDCEEMVLRMRSGALRTPSTVHIAVVDGHPRAEVVGVEPLQGRSHYFIGRDARSWRTNVPQYAKVQCAGVYPGIDLVYYGNQRRLEFDFVVAPGADPAAIVLDVRDPGNGSTPRIDANGDLLLGAADAGEMRLHRPVVSQADPDGTRRYVDAAFSVKGERRIAFEVAAYDTTKPLVIDPVLTYSSYLGGSNADFGRSIAVDGAGNVYLTGETLSFADFPTNTAVSPDFGGSSEYSAASTDAFVTKFNGAAVIYSTYLGGSTETAPFLGSGDVGFGIAVDAFGFAHVTGSTRSEDFPVTSGAFQDDHPSVIAAFVAKLNAGGDALLYSSYLGGGISTVAGFGVATDSSGKTYLAGAAHTAQFPTTAGAYISSRPGHADAFVAKLDTTQSGSASLLYSTLLGSLTPAAHGTSAFGIAVDGAGYAYVTGETQAADFPTTPDAFQTEFAADDGEPVGPDVFVTVIDPSQSGADAIRYSTFIGGREEATGGFSGERGRAIVVRGPAEVYVTGDTHSPDFPTVDPIQPTCGCANDAGTDAFVARLDTTQSGAAGLVWSTFLGGEVSTDFIPTPLAEDFGRGIGLDGSGNVYVAGSTRSTDFPLKNALDGANDGRSDAFLTRIKADGSALLYSTYLGGSAGDSALGLAVDAAGSAYVTGSTVSTDFPTQDPVYGTAPGDVDAFVTKVALAPDFALGPIAAIAAEVGGDGTSQVTVESIDDFSSAVTLSAAAPAFGPSFSPNPVTLPSNDSASSTLAVHLGPSVTPGSYVLTVTGTSGSLSHSADVTVNVTATPGGTSDVIDVLEAAGCIDNSGISDALIKKLAAAQAAIDAGKIQTAINTLRALRNEIQAQAGKHIATTCTVDGVTFDPVQVLLDNVNALLASLGAT